MPAYPYYTSGCNEPAAGKGSAMLRLGVIGAFIILAALLATPARSQDAGRPPVGGVSSPLDAMIFYLARGPAGSCGPDCSEWIAAEGAVQWDSYKRLFALLDRLGGRKAPVILKVRGGAVSMSRPPWARSFASAGSMWARARRLLRNARARAEAACFALKRGGAPLDATIDSSSVECDIVCVLILAGGVHRTLPADAKVVIGPAHIRNRLAPNVSEEHQEGLQSHYGDQFRLYLIQMGVRAELVDILDRNSQARRATRLSRDDWLRLRLVTELAL